MNDRGSEPAAASAGLMASGDLPGGPFVDLEGREPVVRIMQQGPTCALCGEGEATNPEIRELVGPLLGPYGPDLQSIHQGCAVWSPEVFFSKSGRLKNVTQCIRRGRHLKCKRCGKSGATLGCRVPSCASSFHLLCAHLEGCPFYKSSYLITCTTHMDDGDSDEPSPRQKKSRKKQSSRRGCANNKKGKGSKARGQRQGGGDVNGGSPGGSPGTAAAVAALGGRRKAGVQRRRLHMGSLMVAARALFRRHRQAAVAERDEAREQMAEDEMEFEQKEIRRLQRDRAKIVPLFFGGAIASNAHGPSNLSGPHGRDGAAGSSGAPAMGGVDANAVASAAVATAGRDVGGYGPLADGLAQQHFLEGWERVGGLRDTIRTLKEMILIPLLYPDMFQRLHVTPPRGVLLYGHPGTGKTLLVRSLAGACAKGPTRIAFFVKKGADCLGKYAGDAERQLRLLFEEAKRCQPSIIFFDEIDGLAPVRGNREEDQVYTSVVSTLLALMDGLEPLGQVVVIGATNRPEVLDAALRRPGRFDREVYFPLPNAADREAILRVHTAKWSPQPSPRLLKALAAATPGYAGADLQLLCTMAVMLALQRTCPSLLLEEHVGALRGGGVEEAADVGVMGAETVRALSRGMGADGGGAVRGMGADGSGHDGPTGVNVRESADEEGVGREGIAGNAVRERRSEGNARDGVVASESQGTGPEGGDQDGWESRQDGPDASRAGAADDGPHGGRDAACAVVATPGGVSCPDAGGGGGVVVAHKAEDGAAASANENNSSNAGLCGAPGGRAGTGEGRSMGAITLPMLASPTTAPAHPVTPEEDVDVPHVPVEDAADIAMIGAAGHRAVDLQGRAHPGVSPEDRIQSPRHKKVPPCAAAVAHGAALDGAAEIRQGAACLTGGAAVARREPGPVAAAGSAAIVHGQACAAATAAAVGKGCAPAAAAGAVPVGSSPPHGRSSGQDVRDALALMRVRASDWRMALGRMPRPCSERPLQVMAGTGGAAPLPGMLAPMLAGVLAELLRELARDMRVWLPPHACRLGAKLAAATRNDPNGWVHRSQWLWAGSLWDRQVADSAEPRNDRNNPPPCAPPTQGAWELLRRRHLVPPTLQFEDIGGMEDAVGGAGARGCTLRGPESGHTEQGGRGGDDLGQDLGPAGDICQGEYRAEGAQHALPGAGSQGRVATDASGRDGGSDGGIAWRDVGGSRDRVWVDRGGRCDDGDGEDGDSGWSELDSSEEEEEGGGEGVGAFGGAGVHGDHGDREGAANARFGEETLGKDGEPHAAKEGEGRCGKEGEGRYQKEGRHGREGGGRMQAGEEDVWQQGLRELAMGMLASARRGRGRDAADASSGGGGIAGMSRVLVSGTGACGQLALCRSLLRAMEGVPVLTLSLPAMVVHGDGCAEQGCYRIAAEAQRLAPAILFLPELDHWAVRRASSASIAASELGSTATAAAGTRGCTGATAAAAAAAAGARATAAAGAAGGAAAGGAAAFSGTTAGTRGNTCAAAAGAATTSAVAGTASNPGKHKGRTSSLLLGAVTDADLVATRLWKIFLSVIKGVPRRCPLMLLACSSVPSAALPPCVREPFSRASSLPISDSPLAATHRPPSRAAAETGRAERTRAEMSRAETTRAETARAETTRAETARAETARAETTGESSLPPAPGPLPPPPPMLVASTADGGIPCFQVALPLPACVLSSAHQRRVVARTVAALLAPAMAHAAAAGWERGTRAASRNRNAKRLRELGSTRGADRHIGGEQAPCRGLGLGNPSTPEGAASPRLERGPAVREAAREAAPLVGEESASAGRDACMVDDRGAHESGGSLLPAVRAASRPADRTASSRHHAAAEETRWAASSHSDEAERFPGGAQRGGEGVSNPVLSAVNSEDGRQNYEDAEGWGHGVSPAWVPAGLDANGAEQTGRKRSRESTELAVAVLRGHRSGRPSESAGHPVRVAGDAGDGGQGIAGVARVDGDASGYADLGADPGGGKRRMLMASSHAHDADATAGALDAAVHEGPGRGPGGGTREAGTREGAGAGTSHGRASPKLPTTAGDVSDQGGRGSMDRVGRGRSQGNLDHAATVAVGSVHRTLLPAKPMGSRDRPLRGPASDEGVGPPRTLPAMPEVPGGRDAPAPMPGNGSHGLLPAWLPAPPAHRQPVITRQRVEADRLAASLRERLVECGRRLGQDKRLRAMTRLGSPLGGDLGAIAARAGRGKYRCAEDLVRDVRAALGKRVGQIMAARGGRAGRVRYASSNGTFAGGGGVGGSDRGGSRRGGAGAASVTAGGTRNQQHHGHGEVGGGSIQGPYPLDIAAGRAIEDAVFEFAAGVRPLEVAAAAAEAAAVEEEGRLARLVAGEEGDGGGVREGLSTGQRGPSSGITASRKIKKNNIVTTTAGTNATNSTITDTTANTTAHDNSKHSNSQDARVCGATAGSLGHATAVCDGRIVPPGTSVHLPEPKSGEDTARRHVSFAPDLIGASGNGSRVAPWVLAVEEARAHEGRNGPVGIGVDADAGLRGHPPMAGAARVGGEECCRGRPVGDASIMDGGSAQGNWRAGSPSCPVGVGHLASGRVGATEEASRGDKMAHDEAPIAPDEPIAPIAPDEAQAQRGGMRGEAADVRRQRDGFQQGLTAALKDELLLRLEDGFEPALVRPAFLSEGGMAGASSKGWAVDAASEGEGAGRQCGFRDCSDGQGRQRQRHITGGSSVRCAPSHEPVV
eukprot:jgi/Mesvir1/8808/Mv02711-RA.1